MWARAVAALANVLAGTKKVTMDEWERSAVVTVWIRVRTLLVSLVRFEFYPPE